MDSTEFEKAFLSLVNQTDVVITAANIAYHLGIPIDEAQEQLLSLELNGVLLQQTDEDHNTYYVLPNRPDTGTPIAQLSADAPGGGAGVHDPASIAGGPVYRNAAAKGRNVNGLVLNVILPGVGSLICGRKSGGAMLGLFVLGILLIFALPGWSKLLSILPLLIAWLWSIVAGVALLGERKRGPGMPRH